ncbi:MAG: cysteine desulfurase [Geminicoccaceae bacterium]|nr:cysteine desulfurase [Geminicoccaceae bacterium]
MSAYWEGAAIVGNPSSVHVFGRRSRAALERARRVIARAVGGPSAGTILTSGATEANGLALAQAGGGPILTSAIEHPSVLDARDALRLGCNGDGLVDPDDLAVAMERYHPALVSVMLANNEIGTVQPMEALAAIVHEYDALLHVDAVQALGRMDVDMSGLGADMLSISAHKIGGPKGVGALVVRDGLDIAPNMRGGGQEQRRRSGTEHVAGAMGFAAAIDAIDSRERERIRQLRDALENALAGEAVIVARQAPRIPNTSAIAMPGVTSAIQVMSLDLDGVAVSSGSACSSGKVSRSHVLEAMGVDEAIISSTIRVSLGWDTSDRDIECFIEAWRRVRNRCGSGG